MPRSLNGDGRVSSIGLAMSSVAMLSRKTREARTQLNNSSAFAFIRFRLFPLKTKTGPVCDGVACTRVVVYRLIGLYSGLIPTDGLIGLHGEVSRFLSRHLCVCVSRADNICLSADRLTPFDLLPSHQLICPAVSLTSDYCPTAG